nr:immunoglobulin light chain junction region [Macaca mulatta]MOX17885.1 immunoglobulin light chain junction region [Macaca mulatta]MOX19815.1 immunoglobulin light chain junction region [Macaca mulatta]MOX20416.1 immunoglobulin light chain junction region [Macaca mulatta]MOX21184.1 immunoglobulin light chain junction region [Macaca mulatta]
EYYCWLYYTGANWVF